MGTDNLGRDIMAGMIHGTRTAMLVGIISMSIAVCIGVLLGSLAGYYGDHRLQWSRATIGMGTTGLFAGIYYGGILRGYHLKKAIEAGYGEFFIEFIISCLILFAIVLVFQILAIFLKKIDYFARLVYIPVDVIISRLIEIKVSIPTMLIVLSVVAVMKSPSIIMVMVIIGLTTWTNIAKYTRAEFLKVRSQDYILAAQSLGYGEWRIICRHALPNAVSSVLVAVAFGIAGAILLESTLSFLGIGLRPEDVTWGSMLSSARGYFKAWWLAIFPGLAIFVTVTVFNLLGEGLTDAMDPRLK